MLSPCGTALLPWPDWQVGSVRFRDLWCMMQPVQQWTPRCAPRAPELLKDCVLVGSASVMTLTSLCLQKKLLAEPMEAVGTKRGTSMSLQS